MVKNEVVNTITKFIFIEDKPEKVDLLIVAGSSAKNVSDRVAEIYKIGLVRKIIFTGGFNEHINGIESELMSAEAVKKGVSPTDIFLDKKSKNTKENSLEALRIVKKYEITHKKIMLIGLPYHSRRLQMTFKKVFPESQIFTISSKKERINKNDWWLNDRSKQKVMGEIEKIGKYYLKGDLTL